MKVGLIKKIIAILISIGLGLVFIYSGYTKLLPVIETFEFTFVDIGVANWYSAPVMARLLIGLEFFIGLLLILNYNLKKFTLPFTIGILLFFIIYLSVQIGINGNNGNCGCFGEHHRMSPLQAIVKNIIMIAGALIVYFIYGGWKFKFNKLFLSFVGVTIMLLPFFINPIDYSYTSNNMDEKVNYPLPLDLLYHPEDTAKVEVPKKELRSGKHVIAFLSLTCQHCRIAAKKFRLIKKKSPTLSVYFILNGDKENLPEFLEDTGTQDIPSSMCLGKTFIQLASAHLPQIYYIDNGIVIKKVDYFELNQYRIEEWVKTGKAD
ncbi:MAG: DoxX family protein [Bacteroidetes bacterium]|nr:DoxX family protein [Bacteroidota bacterium]